MFKFYKTGEVRPVGKVFDPNYMLQMDRSQRVKQLLVVPVEVQKWLGFRSSSEINQVASYLEPIEDFKAIESVDYLVETFIQLWNSNCSTIRIGNKKITLLIKEVVGLHNLLVEGTAVIFSIASSKIKFYHFTGLKESVMQGSD